MVEQICLCSLGRKTLGPKLLRSKSLLVREMYEVVPGLLVVAASSKWTVKAWREWRGVKTIKRLIKRIRYSCGGNLLDTDLIASSFVRIRVATLGSCR